TFTLQTQTVADDSTISLSDSSHPTGTVTELTFSLSGAALTLGGVASLTGGSLSLAQVSNATSSFTAAVGKDFTLTVNAGPLTFKIGSGSGRERAATAAAAVND